LYEGRFAKQTVHEKPIDEFFSNISEPLSDYQKADLKRKFSRADQLNVAEQKIYAICWDLSYHYRDNFQGATPFKGQLVTQSKAAALKYKLFLDEIGIVSNELLISPPDEREGEDSAYAGSSDKVKRF
jgi:type I restriction enzyme R subunit